MDRTPILEEPGTAQAAARWLQSADGDSPLLFIAPHGGQAGSATRAMLNPKVNDLYTAEITRELARRLGASAIINAGMDRNRLDLNRLSQVMKETPWMLDFITARVERIVARCGRAVVLLIHGWNVIEPRVDVGIGVKSADGALLPACAAHVSASDAFINGPLLDFVGALRQSGIEPTFGLRYPGAGANNLLQAFTRRHAASEVMALRRLAALHTSGTLEAVQLELSVALRMPGRFRNEAIAAIANSFARCDGRRAVTSANRAEHRPRIEILRTPETPPKLRRAARQLPSAGPRRVGLEFYDPSAQIGVLASFDLGAGAAGARVMAITGRERIALFTAEGRVQRTPRSLTLGPLAMRIDGNRLRFDFAGPAIVVDDGNAYLSVERALSKAALHETMKLHAEFESWPGAEASGATAETLIELISHPEHASDAIFGRVAGNFSLAGAEHRLRAVGRIGRSFIGIGSGTFTARRMIWVAFADDRSPRALEARVVINENGLESTSARSLDQREFIDCDVEMLTLMPNGPRRPPHRIAALVQKPKHGERFSLAGEVKGFVMLSRPGPAQSRILTSLGFANFRIGKRCGAGIFERSYRGEQPFGLQPEPAEDREES